MPRRVPWGVSVPEAAVLVAHEAAGVEGGEGWACAVGITLMFLNQEIPLIRDTARDWRVLRTWQRFALSMLVAIGFAIPGGAFYAAHMATTDVALATTYWRPVPSVEVVE